MKPSVTADQIHAAFCQAIKTLHCLECELKFTDYACDWSDAWLEGRNDLLKEDGNHWDATSRKLPLRVTFADEKFRSDFPRAVDIINVQGTGFIDAATAVETDPKQSAIAICL